MWFSFFLELKNIPWTLDYVVSIPKQWISKNSS